MLWRGFLGGVVWLLVVAAVPTPAEAGKTLLRCRDLGNLLSHYLKKHVSHEDLEAELRGRIAHTYLSRVDPQRSLYLAAEAKALESKLASWHVTESPTI